MNNNFYYLPGVYNPITAATNRSLSYLKAFSELGIKTNVVFFRPNENKDVLMIDNECISVKNYWQNFYFNHTYFKYISLLFYYIIFLFTLKKGDIVYCYGCADIWKLILKFRKGVKVYVEYTEHPEVTGIGGHFLTPSLNVFYELIKQIDGLFVITTSLRDFYISKGVSPEKVHIVNITVDAERFKGLMRSEGVEPYIACCGTISNNKDGIDLLIKAFSYVVERFPYMKLYLIGPTPIEKDNNNNMALIKELGLEQSVVFKGVVSPNQIPQMLKDAQMLALCRPNNMQAKFGFATKIGEYLLTQNPVLVTAVGDFPLFFEDGKNALLVQPNDPKAFADRIIWVLDNQIQASEIGEKGAATAEKEFSNINVVRKISSTIGFSTL